MNEFPKIMREAQTDLAGHVPGQFSPESWAGILREANLRFGRRYGESGDERGAWEAVVREFHQQNFWGHSPRWRPPRTAKAKRKNLGVDLVWMTFSAFVVTEIVVAWLGQNYTSSDNPTDAYMFYAALALVVSNFAFFLWRHRHHQD